MRGGRRQNQIIIGNKPNHRNVGLDQPSLCQAKKKKMSGRHIGDGRTSKRRRGGKQQIRLMMASGEIRVQRKKNREKGCREKTRGCPGRKSRVPLLRVGV